MDTYYYKQPRYYEKFKCIGGECPYSCCDGWRVSWRYDEVERLKSADMPDELRARIDEYMIVQQDQKTQRPTNEEKGEAPESAASEREELTDEEKAKKYGYIIKMCDDKRCPFHNRETDLCDIQRTVGAEYFGITCSHYPRRERMIGDIIVRSCTSSCPAVLKLIMKDKRACELETVPARTPRFDQITYDKLEQLESQPYLPFRVNILDFYNDLFRTGSQNATFEETVLLGALAAKAMSKASRMGHAYEIPLIAADGKKKLKTKEHIQWARALEPDPEIKFQLVNSLIASFSSGEIDISPLCKEDGKTIDIGNYNKGRELFEKAIPEHDKVFKAIALNIFLDTFMFVPLQEFNFFEFYAYYTVCLAAMQVSAYLAGLKNEDIENEFILNVAKLSRGISHNEIRAKDLVNSIHKAELMYPPQLAFIIK